MIEMKHGSCIIHFGEEKHIHILVGKVYSYFGSF
jgi:hypothetical protein